MAIRYQIGQIECEKLKVFHPNPFLSPMPPEGQGINPNFPPIDTSSINSIHKSKSTNQALNTGFGEW